MNIPHKVLKTLSVESIFLDLEPKVASRLERRVLVILDWPRTYTANNVGTIEAATSLAAKEQSTDFVIRAQPNEEGGSMIDVRSSPPGRRRDLGLNMVVIRKFIDQLDLEIAKSEKALN